MNFRGVFWCSFYNDKLGILQKRLIFTDFRDVSFYILKTPSKKIIFRKNKKSEIR